MSRLRAKAGYALPAVLGVVAVLSLVFVSAAAALAGLADSARGSLAAADFERRALSAESRARLAAATLRLTPQALTGADPSAILRLDGREYAAPDDPAGRFALQDEAGLLNLDASRPDTLLRLFARVGLSASASETLRDELLDALDADEDRRPRGAEAADYARRGRPRPPPGGFAESLELAAVLDWNGLTTPAQRRALADLTTVDPASHAFNAKTAPAEVLSLVLAMPPEAAAAFVAARERAPPGALVQRGLPGSATDAAPQASGRLRFSFADARLGLRYTSRLASGGAGTEPPWPAFEATTRHEPSAQPSPPKEPHVPPDPPGAPSDR